MYKLHTKFTTETRNIIASRLPSIREEIHKGLLDDIVILSRMGVLPEGSSVQEQARVNNGIPIGLNVNGGEPSGTPTKLFKLSDTSKSRLKVLKPELTRCVELAITKSHVDFGVSETVRSITDQKKAVQTGHSRTMKSKHLIQSDGYVWAVDLVAYDANSKVTWALDHYAEIARAMDWAATELGIAGHVRWGCAWDRVLSDFGGSQQSYIDEIQAYAKRHAGSDLIDAPHFEWVA